MRLKKETNQKHSNNTFKYFFSDFGKVLKKQGKPAVYFVIMNICFFVIILLRLFNVIPFWLHIVIVLLTALSICILYLKKHKGDEDELN